MSACTWNVSKLSLRSVRHCNLLLISEWTILLTLNYCSFLCCPGYYTVYSSHFAQCELAVKTKFAVLSDLTIDQQIEISTIFLHLSS